MRPMARMNLDNTIGTFGNIAGEEKVGVCRTRGRRELSRNGIGFTAYVNYPPLPTATQPPDVPQFL
jgi:hypothetical protein